MFKVFKKIISEEVSKQLEVQKTTQEENFPLVFEVMKDLELTENEKQTLTKLGTGQILPTILEKYLFALSARALSSHTLEDIAELRGGVKTLQFLQSEMKKYAPKTKVNHLTGEVDK